MTFLNGPASLPALDLRRRGQFQAEDRLQLVDRPHARRSPGSGATRPSAARGRRASTDTRSSSRRCTRCSRLMRGALAAADFAVDLRDVEDVDVDARSIAERAVAAADAAAALVVVAGDDLRRVGGELGDALEDVLRRVRA